MTTRQLLTEKALSFNGVNNGVGYDVANPFSADLGRPAEAYCADYVTDMFKRIGLPLPPMQPGLRTGFSYVPAGWAAAVAKGANRHSWEAQPGDGVVFGGPGWNPNLAPGEPGHVELATSYAHGDLLSIGANSGPSNVDGYRGEGGVHRHTYWAPAGAGNDLIIGVIDFSHYVTFGGVPHLTKPGTPPATHPDRTLMAKTPTMKGPDVAAIKVYVGRPVDGTGYDGHCARAVLDRQHGLGIAEDGIVGPQTWAAFRAHGMKG